MYLQVNKGEQFEGESRKVALWRSRTYGRSWFCLTVTLRQLSITRLSLLLQFSMFFASTFVRPLVRGSPTNRVHACKYFCTHAPHIYRIAMWKHVQRKRQHGGTRRQRVAVLPESGKLSQIYLQLYSFRHF